MSAPKSRWMPLPLLILWAGACALRPGPGGGEEANEMEQLAERYVRLVLGVGAHDPGYVDAYYGPPAWQQEVAAASPSLPELEAEALALTSALSKRPASSEADARRLRFLAKQLHAIHTRLRMLQGDGLDFDAESKALYDAVAPIVTEPELEELLSQLEHLLPGEGPLEDRYEAWRRHFLVPEDRLMSVLEEALAGCRERTEPHLRLPEGDGFRMELVSDKPWSGYNWYQGGYQSLIQINIELPFHIDRALDIACHEGYPGHHLFNALIEERLVKGRGWTEFTVYPLYSPQSLLAEGTANFGIRVAFPGEEKVRFEAERLYPLAGLAPSRAPELEAVSRLLRALRPAVAEGARRYLDGRLDREETLAFLRRYGPMTEERAAQRLRFIETYRSYIINYDVGEAWVAGHVDARGGTAADPKRRWEIFEELLVEPHVPSELEGRPVP